MPSRPSICLGHARQMQTMLQAHEGEAPRGDLREIDARREDGAVEATRNLAWLPAAEQGMRSVCLVCLVCPARAHEQYAASDAAVGEMLEEPLDALRRMMMRA